MGRNITTEFDRNRTPQVISTVSNYCDRCGREGVKKCNLGGFNADPPSPKDDGMEQYIDGRMLRLRCVSGCEEKQ